MSITLATKLIMAAAFASPLAAVPLVARLPADANTPALIALSPGTIEYRAAGEFTRGGRPVGAPSAAIAVHEPLAIMRQQVSVGDYRLCVAAGACGRLAAGVAAAADHPVVEVSWRDAERYATWLSRTTGDTYRLPTDEEWAYAAGSRWRDDSVTVDASDPSRRALARYERESALKDEADDGETRPIGGFGANEYGLVDLAGNVWEWTSTCYRRTRLNDAGAPIAATENCGVRVAEGRHRAYITDFVRDARAGGCAAGVPPSHLGFRLVREPRTWRARVMAMRDTVRSLMQ